MQAQKESPPDMQCKDKFLFESVVASPGLTVKDVTAEMFNKELGNRVDECMLRVVYVPPPTAPSPVHEELDEGYSPTASVSVNGTANQFPHSNLNSKRVAENNESIPELGSSPVGIISTTTSKKSAGELLQIEPLELQFPFELKKQISCSLQLTNKYDDYVAFKVKTTNPKKYCVRPITGVLIPQSTCEVVVTMQAQKESPPDMQCVVASPGLTVKDVTAEMFNKELGNRVDECKLRVVYVPPPSAPSPSTRSD